MAGQAPFEPRAAIGPGVLLGASVVLVGLAPLAIDGSYSIVEPTTSESAGQLVGGSWVARTGFLCLGFAVLWLARLRTAAWGFLGALIHSGFAVAMIATAVFASRPWLTDAVYDDTEDLLHSIASFGVGISFTFGVLIVGMRRARAAGRACWFDLAAFSPGPHAVSGRPQPRLGGRTAAAGDVCHCLHLVRDGDHRSPSRRPSLASSGGAGLGGLPGRWPLSGDGYQWPNVNMANTVDTADMADTVNLVRTVNPRAPRSRVRWTLLSLLVGAVLLIAGCGSDSNESANTSASTDSSPSTSTGTSSGSSTSTSLGTSTSTTGAASTTAGGGSINEQASGSGCTPSGDVLPDGHWFGFVDEVAADELSFDLACWFTGSAAAAAATEDGEESPPPNDYYIRNESDRLRSLAVDRETMVSWLPDPGDPGTEEVIAYEAWRIEQPGRAVRPGVWLDVENGAVVAIEEQYVP